MIWSQVCRHVYSQLFPSNFTCDPVSNKNQACLMDPPNIGKELDKSLDRQILV